MKPAAVTDSLLHNLVMSSAAEGTGHTAVAAAVTLGERILLCGHDTRDFDREWDLPGGMPLPGETLTSALSRILACDYGLDATEFEAYLGRHDHVHDGEIIRTFVFTATCADPMQICRHARTAHCWADPADLPEQASQDLARLADIAMLAAAAAAGAPGSAPIPFLFDVTQARLLLDAAGALPDNSRALHRGQTYRTIFALCYGLGLRAGEACGGPCPGVARHRALWITFALRRCASGIRPVFAGMFSTKSSIKPRFDGVKLLVRYLRPAARPELSGPAGMLSLCGAHPPAAPGPSRSPSTGAPGRPYRQRCQDLAG